MGYQTFFRRLVKDCGRLADTLSGLHVLAFACLLAFVCLLAFACLLAFICLLLESPSAATFWPYPPAPPTSTSSSPFGTALSCTSAITITPAQSFHQKIDAAFCGF